MKARVTSVVSSKVDSEIAARLPLHQKISDEES
jgi:hypothetical protein